MKEFLDKRKNCEDWRETQSPLRTRDIYGRLMTPSKSRLLCSNLRRNCRSVYKRRWAGKVHTDRFTVSQFPSVRIVTELKREEREGNKSTTEKKRKKKKTEKWKNGLAWEGSHYITTVSLTSCNPCALISFPVHLGLSTCVLFLTMQLLTTELQSCS